MPSYKELISSHITALTSAAVGVITLHKIYKWHMRRKRLRELTTNFAKVDLLPSEKAFVICSSVSTSTVTFFEGDVQAAKEYFSERIAMILNANRWLDGCLDHDENGDIALFVPKETNSTKVNNSIFQVLELKESLPTHYHTMIDTLASAAMCGNTFETLGTNDPLWKATLIPNGLNRFALVVSANHSFLDGHGFYKIYNMLSEDQEIQSLSPKRKIEIPQKIEEAMGSEKSILAEPAPGFTFRFLYGVFKNAIFPRTKSFGFQISPSWIQEQKSKALSDGENQVAFVSTNDLVVSQFCNSLKCDLAVMAINFRGRVDNCGESDVGNYEELIAYTKQDYKFPALIRKSISAPPYRRAGNGHMPTNMEHLSCTYGAITNWATFAKELKIGNTTGDDKGTITQTLHIPLFDFPKSTPACIFGAIVIFKPKEGSVGALVAGKQELIDAIKGSGMVGQSLEDFEF